MMNFHKEYKIEHEGVNILETEYGFATYKFYPTNVCLMELYVTPSERGKGKAQELVACVKELAQAEGVNEIVSMVDPNDVLTEPTAGALIGAGLKKVGKISVELDSYRGDVCRG